MAKQFAPVTVRPLTGLFDCRSSADEKPPGSFSWKQNFAISPDGSLGRALGWLRFGSILCPSNSDFHDQDVPVADREPITLMFSSVENDGSRRLFIGTKTRLLVLDEAAGVYTPLVGGPFGADGSDSLTQTRFNAAELANSVLFTNDLDLVQLHTLGGAATVAPITSLETAGKDGGPVIKAKRVIAWQGLMFLLNVEEDGVRHANRIRWSDFNDPTWWNITNNPVTLAASIADFQDLDPGEVILNVLPMGGALYVFTDRSIWRCTTAIAADELTLSCIRVFTEPKNRDKCLAYPNTLIGTGFSAYYLGNDGIYEFNQYLAEPERVEWIHRATPVIFKNAETRIDKQACNSPVAEYVPGINEDATAGDGELHFSWARYAPDAVLVAEAAGCPPAPRVEGDGINGYTLVVNTKYKTADFRDYGSTAMVNFTSDLNVAGECNQQSEFLSANASDWTIKKMNIGFAREMHSQTAGYSLTGYFSICRLVLPVEKFHKEKEIQSFLVEATPVDPLETAVLRLRIGTSYESLDPNLGISVNGAESDALKAAAGSCRVLWHQLSDKPLKCSNSMTPEQYKAKNLRPVNPLEWRFLYRGNFLYVELTTANQDGTAPTTGGCSISRFEVDVRLVS